MQLIFLDPITCYYLKGCGRPFHASGRQRMLTSRTGRQAVFPAQPECSNPALKAHEWPVLMQLLDLIFLLLLLLCISEKQPGGSCLSLRAADHSTMILRDKANIRNASDSYIDSIRAETVSIRALLFKLLAAVAPVVAAG